MTRVLLINPPSPEQLGAPLLGLQYVAASLLARCCEVRVIDAAARYFNRDFDWIVDQAEAFSPHIVGFGLFTRWVWHAYKLVERFENRFPLLVSGGAHATVRPDETLEHGFGVAVIGEAERAIGQIVDYFEGRVALDEVRGIRFRGPDGCVQAGPPAVFIDDLDSLALPQTAQPLFDRYWYDASGREVIPGGILTSRGCPARCTFCANYVTGRGFRYRSSANVVAELNSYHKLSGATFFPCWDDALTANKARLFELCADLKSDADFDLGWSAITRASMITPELLRAMKSAGCLSVNFGVESGDDEILRAIKKGITTDQVVRALEWAKSEGLMTACNFMVGFPQETPRALERTLRFMERIAPLVDTFSTLGVVVPFPGTPLYEDHHAQYGFTEWWLREECSRYAAPPPVDDFDRFYRHYIDDANLDLDFFHYSEEMRRMMRACMKFKAEHNLRRMGLLKDPVFSPKPVDFGLRISDCGLKNDSSLFQSAIRNPQSEIGWDDPRTVRHYEDFCRRHDRYRIANEALVKRALLGSGRHILDVAAGTGRTAEVALPLIPHGGRIVCLEPFAAMRAEGERRLDNSRVTWTAEYPGGTGVFDRILCGAAIWQLLPLDDTFRKLAALLAQGGALCFNIPSLYLGEADDAGGGRDPLLLELPSLVSWSPIAADTPSPEPFLTAERLEMLLAEAGLRAERWSFRIRLTQEAYRDWLKIPVLTNNLLRGIDPDERARAIDAAFARVDPHSWRWERWTGWTAWKP